MSDAAFASSAPVMGLRRKAGSACGAATVLLLSACGAAPPTADEIRGAYATHVERDPVHEVGLRARQAPAVIPQQQPGCTADGNSHFDCRIRVIFETERGRRSEEQVVHIKREGAEWVIDSIN